MNQQNDDRDGVRPPKNPKHQHTKKPNANSAGGQRQQPNPNTDLLAARKRHIRYRKRVHINELKTGDNADTLREKRRLVQKEFEAGRLDGKATRELHDLYAKRNIGKIEHQRTLAHNLSDGAKEAKERLEEVFGKTAGAGGADGSGDGGEMPMATTITFDGIRY